MSKWVNMLAGVDDDYLIGLSNKGTVKRAYKDKEQTVCEVLSRSEDDATVKVGEETCKVCIPLGESSCSCQSRSICRHVILAILTVKETCAADKEKQKEGNGGQEEEGTEAGTEKKEEESKEKPKKKSKKENEEERFVETKEETGETEQTEQTKQAFPQIESYPLNQLLKTLGSRRFQAFLNKVKSGWKPEIQKTSIITVKFPDTTTTVKLLEPVTYSTCSCHKKDLCEHKAEAILWYQLQCGILKEEDFDKKLQEPQDIDLEQIHEAAASMVSLIISQLAFGFSRTSQDVVDSMERMAIISHNQGLAECERQFRALAELYQQYFKRMASFREDILMQQMMRLFSRTKLLSQVEDVGEAVRLSGEFKSDYQPVGELYLTGIGTRYFRSKSGYEGETFYFLEERSAKWYTYTNARPVFYENRVQRNQLSKSQVPWNLTVTSDQLPNLNLHLVLAKANLRRRLSSSQETRADILGKRTLKWNLIKHWYYRDFGLLFNEQIKKNTPKWLVGAAGGEYGFDDSQSLVFVQAKTVGEAVFDTINQTFRLPLYDAGQRMVMVEVLYSKEEAYTIQYLERIARRIRSNTREIPCFVGSVYLKDGEVKLYPVTCLEQKELNLPIEEEEKKPGQTRNGLNQEDVANSPKENQKAPDKFEVMEQLVSQATDLLTDIFQSGFDTVHDSTLEEMQRYTVCIKQHGLHYLARQMEELLNQLKNQRHQMVHQYEELAALFENISQYLFFFRDELQKDKVSNRFEAARCHKPLHTKKAVQE